MTNLYRKSHLLGAKLKNIRKVNKLTLEELSERCSQEDTRIAPSVSYLSMIENGKRLPSEDVLEVIAIVFQKESSWFLDENLDMGIKDNDDGDNKSKSQLPLEPGFLYSKDLLQGAIPELLNQSGISGRQFAQLLIRSYQEINYNRFPDIEKIADEIGKKTFPLGVNDLKKLYKTHGLKLKWFNQNRITTSAPQIENKMLLRSFFDSPSTVYVNENLKNNPERLKYDLATHLGHKIMHQGDGLRSIISSGNTPFDSQEKNVSENHSHDVLMAWHDFESSFFGSALLCPRKPFRSFLVKNQHEISSAKQLEISPALMMRRITAVSNYLHWHYFEAFQPGFLSAVYRANGITLPFGNMSMATNPCPNWAIFRLLNEGYVEGPQSQISLLKDGKANSLYCCHSIRNRDLAGNLKLYSLGIDIVPALKNQGINPLDYIEELENDCQKNNGEALIKGELKTSIEKIAHILKIHWLNDALENPVRIICPRSLDCQREKPCLPKKNQYKFNEIESLKENILLLNKAKLI